MNQDLTSADPEFTEDDQLIEPVEFHFGLDRRAFVKVIGAGLMIAAAMPAPAQVQQETGAQRGGGRGGGANTNPAGRIQIGADGIVTVMTGKVEVGQGSRAELTQATAEELRLSPKQILMIMGDTGRVPNDGGTFGSSTSPNTVRTVRLAAAMAREILAELAAQKWNVEKNSVIIAGGTITHAASQRSLTFGELAKADNLTEALKRASTASVTLTESKDFKVLGTPVSRPNARDLVTGAHQYPSDIQRPGMLYGKVLRAPYYDASPNRSNHSARLISADLGPAKAIKDVVAVQDGEFVGVCAPTTNRARQAVEAIAATAKWEPATHPSSAEVHDYLRKHTRGSLPQNPFAAELAAAGKKLKQSYQIAYIQHAPMETRCAVAEWQDGKLTVWTGTQNPFGVQGELVRAFGLSNDAVRVIMPDTGGGFGGKHTGESAIEAARLARAAGKPVCLKWTREEEFTWAYFRPAGLMDIEASLDNAGKLTSWHFININSGNAAVESPYDIGQKRSSVVRCDAPVREGSYRSLAAAGNTFARECFMDELAEAAGADPLDFRLAHLGDDRTGKRLRSVLEEAARRFNWRAAMKQKQPNIGVGLACGFDKGSVVAACAEIAIDRQRNTLAVRRMCMAFECGTIYNPTGLRSQVEGGLIMGLGGALREEIRFADGKIQNPRFSHYPVPRYGDVPELDIALMNQPDQPAVGAGETPIIGVAPAIANAVFHATGRRVRALPIRLPETG